MANLYIRLEDRLLLKLIQAVQSLLVAQDDTSPTAEIQNLFDSHRLDTLEQDVQQKVCGVSFFIYFSYFSHVWSEKFGSTLHLLIVD